MLVVVFLSTSQLNRPAAPSELSHTFFCFLNIIKPKYVEINDIVEMSDFAQTV